MEVVESELSVGKAKIISMPLERGRVVSSCPLKKLNQTVRWKRLNRLSVKNRTVRWEREKMFGKRLEIITIFSNAAKSDCCTFEKCEIIIVRWKKRKSEPPVQSEKSELLVKKQLPELFTEKWWNKAVRWTMKIRTVRWLSLEIKSELSVAECQIRTVSWKRWTGR